MISAVKSSALEVLATPMFVTPDPTGPCKLTATAGLAALYMVRVVTMALALRLVSLGVVVPDASVKAKCNWLVGTWARTTVPYRRQPSRTARPPRRGEARAFLKELFSTGWGNIGLGGWSFTVRAFARLLVIFSKRDTISGMASTGGQ